MSLKLPFSSEKFLPLIRKSWSLSWPMVFIMLYEFLIGLTDVYVAGKFGRDAQAAYGFAFQMYFVFIIMGIALTVGIVSVVSRLFGSQDRKDFETAVNSSLILSAFFGMIFGALGLFFSKDLINVFALPPEVKTLAIPFVMIYSVAFLFDYILMSANGILRACDMIKRSLGIMTIACVMNVLLDFMLSFYTPLGLKGIAWATVISIAFGAILSLFYVIRITRVMHLSFSVIRSILKISWPSGLLQMFWQTGSLVLFSILSLLPRYNVETMAALTNGLKIESAIFLPAFAFNMANAVVVGNFMGKSEEKDAFCGGLVTAILGVSIVSVLTIAIMFNAERIARSLSGNEAVISRSIEYIYIALISEPVMAWGVILGGGLNGAGDTKSVMMIVAFSVWLVRIPLCYIFGVYLGLGAVAIWWVMNISIIVQAALITKRYWDRHWTKMAIGHTIT